MSRALTGVRSDRSHSYCDLENLAALVRHQLDIEASAAIDALHLFEDLHRIGIKQADGVIIPVRSGVIAIEDSEGYARYDRNLKLMEILASETSYRRLECHHPRAAFFVAHELGHCLLHTEQLIRLAQLPSHQQAAFHRGKTGHKPYEDTEWQANAFAGALLMPAKGLLGIEEAQGSLTAGLIVERFSVSYEAAGYRLDLFSARREELLR